MRVITWARVSEFIEAHANAGPALRSWRTQIESRDYDSPTEIKRVFPYASIIDHHRVVFNIKGNAYRLVAAIHYDRKRLFVRGVYTHSEYDRIDVKTV